jgi:hypothetical protein
MIIGIGVVASANLVWAFLFDERSAEPVTPSAPAAVQASVPLVDSQADAQRPSVQSVERGPAHPPATDARVVASTSAARPAHTAPVDAADTARRFFGEEADAIAMKWRDEPTSAEAEPTQDEISEVYASADALAGVHKIECRTTLCRIQLDRKLAMADRSAVSRLVGKLGPVGWMQRPSTTSDELVVFIPMDFKPM